MSISDTALWTKEEVFHDGDLFFSSLLWDIGHAKGAVELESYIFENDKLGARVADALAIAARRGVRVRVSVDGFGSPTWAGSALASRVLESGAEARIYHPFPWIAPFSRYFEAREFRFVLALFSKLNRRNHRKMAIVDSRIAYIGSMNITQAHLRSLSGEKAWRDTGARVEGPPVLRLHKAFRLAWMRSWRLVGLHGRANRVRRARQLIESWWRSRRFADEGVSVRLNMSRRSRMRAHRELIERIEGAQGRIWITTAYFVPVGTLRAALGGAARRGVDVRVLVPLRPDVVFIRWVAAAFYEGLLRCGVQIHEYEPSPLHAKTVLIDEWAVVGSTNLNHRSFLHDLEVDVVLRAPLSIESLRAQFKKDLERSVAVSLSSLPQRSWLERWMGKLLLGLRRLM